jgi:hypothetical protein
MSTTPPERPTPPPGQPSSSAQEYARTGPNLNLNLGATWPTPGNAELLVYAIVVLFLIIIWAASDKLGAGDFSILLTILTGFYLLSRGIAKASRVLER